MPERKTDNTVQRAVASGHHRNLDRLLILLGLTGFSITEPILAIFGANPGVFYRIVDPIQPAVRSEENFPSVMFILLDEFPTLGLFDEDEGIDPVRFPNLTALSEQAIWYRRYTVLHGTTKISVPAILTRKDPQHVPASFSSHTDSLFSLVAPTHEIVAFETITGLCGLPQCGEQAPGTTVQAAAPRTGDLLAESGFLWWRRISLTDTGGARLDTFAEEFSARNQNELTSAGAKSNTPRRSNGNSQFRTHRRQSTHIGQWPFCDRLSANNLRRHQQHVPRYATASNTRGGKRHWHLSSRGAGNSGALLDRIDMNHGKHNQYTYHWPPFWLSGAVAAPSGRNFDLNRSE